MAHAQLPSLLGLPRELRGQILQELIPAAIVISVPLSVSNSADWQAICAMESVCRQLCGEAREEIILAQTTKSTSAVLDLRRRTGDGKNLTVTDTTKLEVLLSRMFQFSTILPIQFSWNAPNPLDQFQDSCIKTLTSTIEATSTGLRTYQTWDTAMPLIYYKSSLMEQAEAMDLYAVAASQATMDAVARRAIGLQSILQVHGVWEEYMTRVSETLAHGWNGWYFSTLKETINTLKEYEEAEHRWPLGWRGV